MVEGSSRRETLIVWNARPTVHRDTLDRAYSVNREAAGLLLAAREVSLARKAALQEALTEPFMPFASVDRERCRCYYVAGIS